ncbi:MAG: 2-C-methyl-D-erythritol 4-phosphate cytidylyltransferase [Phycisphaerae bacterium]
MSDIAVIIPAAGAGKRFGGDVKKPFVQIDNRPIFVRTIELFINREDVCQTILTVSPDDYDVVREKYAANLMFMGIKLVKGGAERYDSVRAALAAVDDNAKLVCIHDAVRPCVLPTWIDDVFKEARATGAAILGVPITGTVKRVSASMVIDETVSREGLYEAQTPQVFSKAVITAAYDKLSDTATPTDDAGVVERSGHPVSVVASDRRNIKITSAGDLPLAEAILKTIARAKKSAGPLGAFGEAEW